MVHVVKDLIIHKPSDVISPCESIQFGRLVLEHPGHEEPGHAHVEHAPPAGQDVNGVILLGGKSRFLPPE